MVGGVGKSKWGPPKWKELHTHARNYAGVSAAAHEPMWLSSFVQSLPCPECRQHATQFIRDNPPFLQSNAAYQLWAFQFHNSVSSRLGKPLFTLEQYKKMYGN